MKKGKDKYPFNEGDDYWTVETSAVIWSCWDDISEEMHDADPTKVYYKTEAEATAVRDNYWITQNMWEALKPIMEDKEISFAVMSSIVKVVKQHRQNNVAV